MDKEYTDSAALALAYCMLKQRVLGCNREQILSSSTTVCIFSGCSSSWRRHSLSFWKKSIWHIGTVLSSPHVPCSSSFHHFFCEWQRKLEAILMLGCGVGSAGALVGCHLALLGGRALPKAPTPHRCSGCSTARGAALLCASPLPCALWVLQERAEVLRWLCQLCCRNADTNKKEITWKFYCSVDVIIVANGLSAFPL